MNPETRPCPSCGGVMTRGTRPETLHLDGHSITYMQPGWHCSECDDGILVDSDNEVHDAAVRELTAMVNGAPISPLTIRTAREAVGLSQREAGVVFGGGPTAFHKYESGQQVPSQGMAKLLRLALQRPELFRQEREEAPTDVQLIQRAATPDHLHGLILNIYPNVSAE